jgi:putative addiction module killer protein
VEARPRELEVYRLGSKHPFTIWSRGLGDPIARRKIRVCLDRAEDGNLGDHWSVGEGVWELRIDYGPGYRIYYGEIGDTIILLTGGTKKTQDNDIARAKKYWRDRHD